MVEQDVDGIAAASPGAAASTRTRPSAKTTLDSVAEPPGSGSAQMRAVALDEAHAQVVLAPDDGAVLAAEARRRGARARDRAPPRRPAATASGG